MSSGHLADVSVIIVNWNTCDLLRQCLQSIRKETHSSAYELIVVDNASADNSRAMVRAEFPEAILIENRENLGFAAANNQGIAVSKGRYVLLLNSDTIVLDRAIDKTITFADKHADTAVVGCRVLNPDLTLQPTCFMFPSILNWFLFSSYLYRIFPRSRFFGREQMTWWQRDDAREVEVVTGCYMLVRKSAFDQVGGLDEQFFMYVEETDWCLRFRNAGWKNRFTPDSEIIHFGGASATKWGAFRAKMTNRSFVRYMFKHWSKGRAILGVWMIALFYSTRLIGLLPIHLLHPSTNNQKLYENHWLGLKDILAYKHHRLP
ncbi:glycosyltransferase family 2 protein [Bradyrhizobium sp. 159]|uniref:glycosyltransferase family 2 protein n=1 Tax=Bradyrhizobium sp. 159 TaxID=2782632 RepID=UPI001FF7BF75|nr:glycosyltransferase family 2 protein [Bradyrhizobium sp. 159]MCK1619035.1 glycosyltransferase family 2 protein [Bradyrhizobium sp. 159]